MNEQSLERWNTHEDPEAGKTSEKASRTKAEATLESEPRRRKAAFTYQLVGLSQAPASHRNPKGSSHE